MSISRECVLHYPFHIKLWLCAESDCVGSIYWNSNKKNIYIDVLKLQIYLQTMESIFNVKNIDDFSLHLDAFGFERKDEALCVVRQYYHQHFRADSIFDLSVISVNGYTLVSEEDREMMQSNDEFFNILEKNEDLKKPLWDFGDFEFNFDVFEMYLKELKQLMLHLNNAVIATKALSGTNLNKLRRLFYCYHMHNIILPATWIPNLGVSMRSPTVNYRNTLDDAMLLEEDLPDEKSKTIIIPNDDICPDDLLNTAKMAIALANQIPFFKMSRGESGDAIERLDFLLKKNLKLNTTQQEKMEGPQKRGNERLTVEELSDNKPLNYKSNSKKHNLKRNSSSLLFTDHANASTAFKNKTKSSTFSNEVFEKPTKCANFWESHFKTSDVGLNTTKLLAEKLLPILERKVPESDLTSNISDPLKIMQDLVNKVGPPRKSIEKSKKKLFVDKDTIRKVRYKKMTSYCKDLKPTNSCSLIVSIGDNDRGNFNEETAELDSAMNSVTFTIKIKSEPKPSSKVSIKRSDVKINYKTSKNKLNGNMFNLELSLPHIEEISVNDLKAAIRPIMEEAFNKKNNFSNPIFGKNNAKIIILSDKFQQSLIKRLLNQFRDGKKSKPVSLDCCENISKEQILSFGEWSVKPSRCDPSSCTCICSKMFHAN